MKSSRLARPSDGATFDYSALEAYNRGKITEETALL